MDSPRTASYLACFRRDLREVFERSEEEFGTSGADRYPALIEQALTDIRKTRSAQGQPDALSWRTTSASIIGGSVTIGYSTEG